MRGQSYENQKPKNFGKKKERELCKMKEKLYNIVRFHFKGPEEVIDYGYTLEEAQEHCEREDTHGEGWFDAYREAK